MRGLLFTLTLMGCVTPISLTEHNAHIDGDRDGHLPPAAGGQDCDDTNAAIHPDAEEWCNGVDDNCDGQVDPDGARGSQPWWTDADGDGAGDPATLRWACDAGDGVQDDRDCDDDNPDLHALDLDGDGWHLCNGDCDDTNPYAWPGAPEWCGDGLDNDCSGAEDDDAIDALPWYPDTDGDGIGASVPAWACEPPADHVAEAGDCDDTDIDTYPGAPESCDGSDNDCDGSTDEDPVDASWWYSDGDGDGYGDAATATWACSGALAIGGDCDDTDDTIHPGALEVCGDGIDNDCDQAGCGLPSGDVPDTDADLVLSGSDQLGASLASGDLTGNGWPDLIVGEPGPLANAAHLFEGPMGMGALDTADAFASVTDPAGPETGLGQRTVVGDVTADSAPDWILAAPWTGAPTELRGAVSVLAGPIAGATDLTDRVALLSGTDPDGRFGSALALADLQPDGSPELVVSAPTEAAGGAVYLFTTPLPADADATAAVTTLRGTGAGDGMGHALAVADWTGDGLPDLCVGAPDTANGDVWLFPGPVPSGELWDTDAAIHLVGGAADAALGAHLSAGDLNGDGATDLVLSSPGSDEVWVVSGPWFPTSADIAAAADVQIAGSLSSDVTTVVGDLNGDGLDDLVVGDPQADVGGIAWVFYGPLLYSTTLDEADARILGAADLQGLGAALWLDDLDGDANLDLILGAPAADRIRFAVWCGSAPAAGATCGHRAPRAAALAPGATARHPAAPTAPCQRPAVAAAPARTPPVLE